MGRLGSKLLYHLVEYKSVNDAKARGILPEHLLDDDAKAYQYTLDLIEKDKRYPSKNELHSKFDIDKVSVDEDDLPGILEDIRARHITSLSKDKIIKAEKLFEKRKVDEACALLGEVASYSNILRTTTSVGHDFKADAERRIEQYERRKLGVDAIPGPWPSFNKHTGGWQEGLYVFVAYTSGGKSWIVNICANDMANKLTKDDKILVCSQEMSVLRMGRRLDVVRYKMPLTKLRDGTLSPAEEEAWLKAIEEDALSDTAQIIIEDSDTVRTCADIEMKIQELEPRAVWVDAAYRLKAYGPKSDWDRQVYNIEYLQDLAVRYGIPLIATTQLGDSGETGKGMDSRDINRWNMRYAKEWILNPDYVWSMQQDEDLEVMNQMELRGLKLRDDVDKRAKFLIHWDKTTMDYSEVKDTFSGGLEYAMDSGSIGALSEEDGDSFI